MSNMTLAFNSTKVRVAVNLNADGDTEYRELDGWDMGVPGLAIVRLPDKFPHRYSVTHKATGYAVCFVEDFEVAAAVLDWLGDEGTDWSHPDPRDEPNKFGPAHKALRDRFWGLLP